jgi:hypothetical protein
MAICKKENKNEDLQIFDLSCGAYLRGINALFLQ